MAKLTEEQQNQIEEFFANETPFTEIARETGLSVYKVKKYLESLAEESEEEAVETVEVVEAVDEVEAPEVEQTPDVGPKNKRPASMNPQVAGTAVASKATSDRVDKINEKVGNKKPKMPGVYSIYAD